MEGAGQGYVAPVVRDYGDLVALTRAEATMLHVGLGGAGANASSTPITPGGGGGGTKASGAEQAALGGTLPADGSGDSGSPDGGGDAGETLGAAGAGGGGNGGGSGGSGGGGGRLPFTGFGVALVGVVGSGMSAAGVALRRRLSRGKSPD